MAGEHVQPRSEKRRQTEDRIIGVAADLFLEHGFKATTVRVIAGAAEVSVGRVMSVGDKDAILVACFDRWLGQLQDGTYTMPEPRRTDPAKQEKDGATSTGSGAGMNGAAETALASGVRPTSAVQRHLLGLFLPFLEFFAAHADLSRDYAAAMMRVKDDPEVFNALAVDMQNQLSDSLVSIGINESYARASASALYDSYLGILFRWAATTMTLAEATDALLAIIAFHTRVRSPL